MYFSVWQIISCELTLYIIVFEHNIFSFLENIKKIWLQVRFLAKMPNLEPLNPAVMFSSIPLPHPSLLHHLVAGPWRTIRGHLFIYYCCLKRELWKLFIKIFIMIKVHNFEELWKVIFEFIIYSYHRQSQKWLRKKTEEQIDARMSYEFCLL